MSAWDIAGAIGWSAAAGISAELAGYLRWGTEREQIRLYPRQLFFTAAFLFPAAFCIARLCGAHA